MAVEQVSSGSSIVDRHVDTARRLYQALEDGDRATLDEILDPDFVGELADGMPFGIGGEHRGADAMRRSGWGGIARHFAARAEPADIVGLDDGRLLVTGRYRGTGRRGGGHLDAGFAHVLTFANGRISALRQYTDTARWTAAAPPFSTLTVDVSDGVARVRMNRPARANAVNAAMGADLARLATALADDDSVRAVTLSGNGGIFTVGGDIAEFSTIDPAELPVRLDHMVVDLHRAVDGLTSLAAPLVAGVNGACAGAGLSLVGAADIVVAGEDASFSVGYTAIGLTGDGGISWTLPRLIGLRRAQELFLTQRRLTAAEALDWGLVTSVVPADEVDATVAAIADRLATGPTAAYGTVRRLFGRTFDSGLREHLAAEQRCITHAAATQDFIEGVTAFVEKRRPRFTGH